MLKFNFIKFRRRCGRKAIDYDSAVLVLRQMFPMFRVKGIERVMLNFDGNIDECVNFLKEARRNEAKNEAKKEK